MCLCVVTADTKRLHDDMQRGQDPGAGGTFNGGAEWELPQHHRGGPDEAHHQIWDDSASQLSLSLSLTWNNLWEFLKSLDFWPSLLRLSSTASAAWAPSSTKSHTTTSLSGPVLTVSMVRLLLENTCGLLPNFFFCIHLEVHIFNGSISRVFQELWPGWRPSTRRIQTAPRWWRTSPRCCARSSPWVLSVDTLTLTRRSLKGPTR